MKVGYSRPSWCWVSPLNKYSIWWLDKATKSDVITKLTIKLLHAKNPLAERFFFPAQNWEECKAWYKTCFLDGLCHLSANIISLCQLCLTLNSGFHHSALCDPLKRYCSFSSFFVTQLAIVPVIHPVSISGIQTNHPIRPCNYIVKSKKINKLTEQRSIKKKQTTFNSSHQTW